MSVDTRRAIEARWVGCVRAALAGEAPAVRLRRAHCVQLEMRADRYRLRSYLSGESIRTGGPLIEALRRWTTWRDTDDPWFHHDVSGVADPGRARQIVRLVELGLVVAEGSPFEQLDHDTAFDWEWGTTSGAFHFAIRDSQWGTPDQVVEAMEARSRIDSGPELTLRHDEAAPRVVLPAPELEAGVYAAMAARVSERCYSGDPIDLGALARVLHSGMGILEWSDEGAFGVLPHAMTPSGGARNPYEAYVAVRAVDGLAPAVYHYSATQHSLREVGATPARLGSLLANIEWIDTAAAVVMLIADFGRTMWKYKHPTAHRVVLLEGGHIAQNMVLAATAEGLGSLPVAAFNDVVVEELLGLDPLRQLAAHAVVLGRSA